MKNIDIDCIITGINAENTLKGCIESVRNCDYPNGSVRIIYVDGGSTDQSVAIARTDPDVMVIEVKTKHPTVGFKRNRGWRAGHAPCVQFLDADAAIAPDFWKRAIEQFQGTVAAVRGRRDERHPETSAYNWMLDLEWNPPPGRCDAFGGEAFILRSALEEVGGYDEELVGGEDWDLSHRIVEKSHSLLNLDAPMSMHEISITSPWQYWKSEYRKGYGFAAVAWRHAGDERKYWKAELQRVAIRGGGALALIVLALLWPFWAIIGLFLLLPAAILLLYPRIFNVDKIAAQHRLSRSKAVRYAWHCSFIAVPQFCGVVRFLIGKLFSWPLKC